MNRLHNTHCNLKSIYDAEEFGCVAVLMGGQSAEREISLKSGNAVLKSLQSQGVDARGIDVGDDVIKQLQSSAFDRAFIVLHGRGGEDGVIQGVLETLMIPYTGSGVLGSALGMNKLTSKQLWRGVGLPTPDYRVLEGEDDFEVTSEALGVPYIVKPVCEGSSLGISCVSNVDEHVQACRDASAVSNDVLMAEKMVEGCEYTVAVLNDEALPVIRVESASGFYDFDAKYNADDTHYFIPCGLDEALEKNMQNMALQAFKVLQGRGWGRIDILCDSAGKTWLIETNTVPGMTDHSLVPMAAKAADLTFDELVWRILEDCNLASR